METAILVLLFAFGGLAIAVFRPSANVRVREPEGVTEDAVEDEPEEASGETPEDVVTDHDKGLGCESMWARHPLEPEAGWMVATAVPWPVRPGDRLCVRRRDGSESLETVERVLLEFREPEGDVVGHLVEVEGA